MTEPIKNRYNSVIGVSLGAYMFLLMVPLFTGFREEIPEYMYILQIVSAGYFFVGMHLCNRMKNWRTISLFIFSSFLLHTLLFRYVFVSMTGDPYNLVYLLDTRAYEGLAFRYLDQTYSDFISTILRHRFGIDDLGYFSISYFVHKLCREPDLGRWIILVMNAFAITISSRWTYKIALSGGIREQGAKFAALFYGLFPFFLVSSVMGLKENIFCFLIVGSLYHMTRYQQDKKLPSLLWFGIFLTITYFFRSVITLMLLICFAISIVTTERNKKKILYVGAILSSIALFGVLPFVIEKFTGISLTNIMYVTQHRIERTSSSPLMTWGIQLLSGAFGPFPNTTRMIEYALLFNSGLMAKTVLGIWAMTGMTLVVKKYEYTLYPLGLYLFMGICMMVFSGVALDIRYHITFFPAFVILSTKALEVYSKSSNIRTILYLICIISVIILYNIR